MYKKLNEFYTLSRFKGFHSVSSRRIDYDYSTLYLFHFILIIFFNYSSSFRATKGATAAEYQANLKKVYTVATVQGFWSVFNHIPCLSELPSGSYYHLMREERPPLWEDPHIMNGGTWRMKCRKTDTIRVWRELLLASIGEQFEDSLAKGDDILGLSVSPRDRDDIIQVLEFFLSS